MANQLIIAFIVSMATIVLGRYTPSRSCEPVETKMCRDLDPKNYISTSYPNFMNQTSYMQVNDELSSYGPLIDSQCSSVLKMFLCSLYVPICKPGVGMRIPPCRNLCEEARKGCKPLLNAAQIQWPESMNCDRFPKQSEHALCIGLPEHHEVKKVETIKPNFSSTTRSTKKVSVSIVITGNETGQTLDLKCDSDKKIFVRKMRFYPHHRSKCCPNRSRTIVSTQCNGKQKCTVKLDQSIMQAECQRISLVTLKYKCVDLNSDVSFDKSMGCRKHKKLY